MSALRATVRRSTSSETDRVKQVATAGVSLALNGGLKGWLGMRVCEVVFDVRVADWLEGMCEDKPCDRGLACPLVPRDLVLIPSSVADGVNIGGNLRGAKTT